jgi:uncharacterized membrane protein
MSAFIPYSQVPPFRWTIKDGMQTIRLPSDWRASYCYPRALSGDGSVIVGDRYHLRIGKEEVRDAFIWDSTNGARDLKSVLVNDYHLDLTGWLLRSATGISSDGKTIVGIGLHSGHVEVWVARLNQPPNLLATRTQEPAKNEK